jgi:hypothetical protein
MKRGLKMEEILQNRLTKKCNKLSHALILLFLLLMLLLLYLGRSHNNKTTLTASGPKRDSSRPRFFTCLRQPSLLHLEFRALKS